LGSDPLNGPNIYFLPFFAAFLGAGFFVDLAILYVSFLSAFFKSHYFDNIPKV